jgi:hypothetical protein
MKRKMIKSFSKNYWRKKINVREDRRGNQKMDNPEKL